MRPPDIEIKIKYKDGKNGTGKISWESIKDCRKFHTLSMMEDVYDMLIEESKRVISWKRTKKKK
jgi:hypothetical protein